MRMYSCRHNLTKRVVTTLISLYHVLLVSTINTDNVISRIPSFHLITILQVTDLDSKKDILLTWFNILK